MQSARHPRLSCHPRAALLLHTGDRAEWLAHVAESGRARFEALPPGSYEVTVDGFTVEPGELSLAPGEERAVAVVVRPWQAHE